MKQVWFDKTADGVVLLAAYLAELEKQGVEYQVMQDATQWGVEVIGH